MKVRLLSLTVALLYALLALPGMGEHHHAEGQLGSHQDCAACVWLINTATDTPATQVSVTRPVTTPHLIAPQSVFVAVVFVTATASRAPPETLA
jgi:hypothetical protein